MPSEFPPCTLAAQALAEGAFAALNAGEMVTHNQIIAETAARDLATCDVIAGAGQHGKAARDVAEATGKRMLNELNRSVAKM